MKGQLIGAALVLAAIAVVIGSNFAFFGWYLPWLAAR